ncbi:MAG TPA: cation transporter [Cellvibrio sp.]|jgi:cation diffusion facilitator family transporter|nr:cation transporter [Cellvibrio sp.]
MSNCGCEVTLKNNEQKRVLYWLLAINAVLFVAEFGIGWFAQSTALIADSLDMLADAVVYAIGLYAVGRAAHHKARAAMLSGYFQMALGLLIIADIVRRAYFGSEPASGLMMVMGSVALVGNVICLVLIQKHRHGDVNMRASWIFSSNDVIANAGVIVSGALVGWLNARWPDMVIGCIIVVIVLRGAQMILKDARKELAQPDVKKTTCGTGQ